MKVFFPMTLALSAALMLSGCTTFMCDTCVSRSTHRREIAAYRAMPRLQTVPQQVLELEVKYMSLDFQYMGSDQVKVLALVAPNAIYRLDAPVVYYQGPFVNPMPITSREGEQYLLDFRLDKDGESGEIYLLNGDGQFINPRLRPPRVGKFLP